MRPAGVLPVVLLLLHSAVLLAADAPATTRASHELLTTKVDVAPTTVNLKLNRVSAAEMFGKLASEARISLMPREDSLWDDPSLQESSFSIEWEKQSLWSAIREACEAAGTRITPDESNEAAGRVQLMKGPMPSSVSIDGPVMIWPRQLLRTAQVTYGDGTHKPDEVRLMLMVVPEPRLRQFAWYDRPRLEKAEDDQGHSLLSPAVAARGSANGTNVAVRLDYPPKVGSKVAIVSGSIAIDIASELATVVYRPPFDKIENATEDLGVNRLVIKSVKKEDNGAYHVNLSLLRGKDETDEHWSAIAEPFGRFAAPVTLVSMRGESRQNGGSAGSGSNEAHCDLYFSPHEAGDDVTELRIVLPTKFTTINANFEFKDLPMP